MVLAPVPVDVERTVVPAHPSVQVGKERAGATECQPARAVDDVRFEQGVDARPGRFQAGLPVGVQRRDDTAQYLARFGLQDVRQRRAVVCGQQVGAHSPRRRRAHDVQLGIELGQWRARTRRKEVGDPPPVRRDQSAEHLGVELAPRIGHRRAPRQVERLALGRQPHPQTERRLLQWRHRKARFGEVGRPHPHLDH